MRSRPAPTSLRYTSAISVFGTRYAAVTLSGILAAMGGAFLSIGFVNSFTENMTAGRGFIALAALIFGGWRPFGAFAASLLFGFSSALAQRLPDLSASESAAWPVLFQTLPYVLTLIAVAGVIAGGTPLWEMPEEQEEVVVDVDLRSVLLAARVGIPALLRRPEPREGRFIAVASAAAILPQRPSRRRSARARSRRTGRSTWSARTSARS